MTESGEDMQNTYERRRKRLAGISLAATAIGFAVYMIHRANREIKSLQENKHG